ncbi:B3 domain-containing transcription factor VRN1 [Daucus carota subsp. sativus]|uniref:B3 domain-containing transcription factor VRN1 n=1 Tax=Daucus carota subsp. sativus TaxID=79200 RepID=UPI003083D2AB
MEASFTSHHHAKARCFFKIILCEISSKSKLTIPEKFVRKYGGELQGGVLLKAPGAPPWSVDVQREEGKGNCNFKVVIFDTSTTEIDYPVQFEERSGSDQLQVFKKKQVHSGCDAACYLGESLKGRLLKEKIAEALSETSISDENEHGGIEKPSHANGTPHDIPMRQHIVKAGGVSSPAEEKDRAHARAKALKSIHPSFKVVMQPSYVGKTYGLFHAEEEESASAKTMKNRRIVRGAPMDPLRSSSAVKPRCFFKIIISHITPHSTLTIPRRFIAQGYDLADKVFLKAPESSVWVVDLERTTGEAVLRNGWPEFAAYYSISIGHVILFKYEGNSQFHVTILDNSCTEIEYPMSASHNEQANRSGGFRKRKEQALITSKEGRKIKGTGIVKPDTVIPSQGNGIRHKRIKPVKVEADLDDPIPHVITAKGASESAIEEGKARALALAKAFKSNKPFFFRRVYPSHVDGTQHGMHVTTAFKEAYENWKDNEQLTLQIAERTWQAECRWTSIGYKIGKGWCKFARDTSLATGDVCVFELVNSSQKLFEVIIYRATVKNENW